MQKYTKIRPVRFNRPNHNTTLASGQLSHEPQPTEFRLAAFTNPDTDQLRVFVWANLPQQPDYVWIGTDIVFAPEEGDSQGIYALRNVDSWCAAEFLKSRLFALFGEAICTGLTIEPIHVQAVVNLQGYLVDHCADMPHWVARIKTEAEQGRINFEQARYRLRALDRLIDALEDKAFILYGTSAPKPY